MSSLADKLKELGVQVGTSQIQTPTDKLNPLVSLVDILPGAWEPTPRGDCFILRKNIPLSTSHGRFQILGPPDMRFFESIKHLEGISDIQAEDFLFIDTETTGLAGGAGSYVFLVGAAKYENETLNFAQFFLQDPANEPAQLAALESFAATSKIVISYNGKSFDLPRLKTRYRFHGWLYPFQDIYHIDLLHFVRRIWKSQLPSCTLGDLETHILGLQRDSLDIPGWKVSDHFYEYLNTKDPTPLVNIFYHNEVDVISLAVLLRYLADRLSSPLSNQPDMKPDLISIGKYYYFLQLYKEAKQVLCAALSNTDIPEESLIIGKLCLASIYKKSGDYTSAEPLWKECADSGCFEAFIDLAKHSEHNLSDYETAIHWTLSAIDALETFPASKRSVFSEQLEHRLRRLKKKAQP